ncbi:MerR family transcriptional regulator [Clostridium sp. ATCC 25772]|uniref:MerR family transcriptional regulator n=1 Tax=Clostridium TaxID=1485 RepID=UPI000781F4D3|nr:MerR family transcriptional regulator [Clostridium sp. ATCC 25772]
MLYKVKEVQSITGVTIRMLHHYDKINLLNPSSKSDAGYRLYNDNDLEKLQQIMFFRELDFSLEEIKEILSSPKFNKNVALENHRKILTERKTRLENLIKIIDNTLEKGVDNMSNNEKFKAFDTTEIEHYKNKYKKEVEAKYSHTDAYKEYKKKASKYEKNDWQNVMEKGDIIFKNLANLMDKSPSDIEVQTEIENWRNHITNSFYNCTIEIFQSLGEMYVNDTRFTENIDKHKSGLSNFINEAIKIYCENNK